MRNSILEMASHDLSNTKTTILGATPGAILGIDSEKRDVHKSSACNSGAGNGRADFMGAWHFLVLSAGKPLMPIKFLLLGGGVGVY